MKSRPAAADLALVQTKPLAFDWTLQFERSETILARDYWSSKYSNGRMPRRSDLVPKQMKAFMPHIGLIEVRPAPVDDYFIRLAGSRWEDVFGAMRGKFLRDFLPTHIEGRWRLLFDSVCAAKLPVRVSTHITFEDKHWIATEMFVAPLSDNGGALSMLFMCFTSWTDPTFDQEN